MSYANGTTYYNLPQTVGADKRDWFDTNSAFAAVDAALHAAATGQAADAEAISTINASLAADEADIAALQTASSTQASQISTLQTTVNAQAAQIADVRQDAEDMITAKNEGAAATSTRAYAIGDYFIYNDVLYKATAAIAVGDTIVPNTNCEATNVDTEITAIKSDLSSKGNPSTLVSAVSIGSKDILGGHSISDFKSLYVYLRRSSSDSIVASAAIDVNMFKTLNDTNVLKVQSYDSGSELQTTVYYVDETHIGIGALTANMYCEIHGII